MRTRIMSGIVGVVVCTGVVLGSATPATAGQDRPAPAPVEDVLLEALDIVLKPQACIDCW